MEEDWGAGIIPVSIYNNKLYVLLGREVKGDRKGTYDAFGGGREPQDRTPKDTAIREGYEESMGFFGSMSYIRKNIKSLGPKFKYDFILKVDYQPDTLPKLFNEVYKYVQSGVVKFKKGYFEKDIIRWFPVNKQQKTTKFRQGFKEFYKYMIDNHDDILRRLK